MIPTNDILAFTHQQHPIAIIPQMLNRHGLIAGATGTGKTVTLRKIAEMLSARGIPIFMADVKGDLSGIKHKGSRTGKVAERMQEYGLHDDYLQGFPVRFWDVYAQTGIPIRVSISQMGPLLLSRLMNLNNTQEGILNLVFRVADDKGWHLIDLKDLRGMLQYVATYASEYQTQYGHISKASIGAIQRQLLHLENEGAAQFFGEPELNLQDWIQTENQQGIINILNAEKLIRSPRLYSAFLLWFLAELFATLPEVGDLNQPKFVLFFDEAHLLFNQATPQLLEQIEQVVRLIRSKGVGVYFITQNPLDIPNNILSQLGNRIQHALRAFTPRDQKAVKTAADTFRSNPNFNTFETISQLAVGEALISLLDEKGMPSIVERANILPPQSQLSPLTPTEITQSYQQDFLYQHYQHSIDNFSAYEAIAQLNHETSHQPAPQNPAQPNPTQPTQNKMIEGFLGGLFGNRKKTNQGIGYDLADGIGKQINKQITHTISRSILGVIKKLIK